MIEKSAINEHKPTVLTVSALNAVAREILETQLQYIWVKGEISNLSKASSGHYYFNLKDNKAQIRCALFKGYASQLLTPLKEGDEVELTGKITLYEARGEFQITVTEVKSVGLGKLFAQYEANKKKLEEEGLFDLARKKSIPVFPKKVGIVTSLSAAALRDVMTTLKRRMSSIEVIVYPSPVQGKGSEVQIAQAIAQADQRQEVDVLLICRGGGSIEDLWAFNEEICVRAIAACSLPTVCGVGHETDFTLSDFVADIRAPTPTAAAEIVSPNRVELLRMIDKFYNQLLTTLKHKYFDNSQKLDWLTKRILHPQDHIVLRKKRLQELQDRSSAYMNHQIIQTRHRLKQSHLELFSLKPDTAYYQQKLSVLRQELQYKKDSLLSKKEQELIRCIDVLEAVSPQRILERGFSVVRDRRGKVIKSIKNIKLGQQIAITFSEGETNAIITESNHQADLFD